MKRLFFFLIIGFFSWTGCAQAPASRPAIVNPAFDKKISRTISFTVPTIGVEALRNETEKVYILDAREKEEFDVSHIPNAQFIGYKKIEEEVLNNIPKEAKVVLYCSIGYRSEKIGEKLQKKGFTNVYNLYGSIFEWVNQGFPVVNSKNKPTKKVHTYNRNWSEWVIDGQAEKVW